LTLRSLKIAGLYSLFGLLWILFSDQILLLFTTDPLVFAKIQTLKGWFFVFVTAVLLFFMVRRALWVQWQRELLVSQSERRFRDLVDTIPDLIWVKDAQGCYLSCNATFERYFGVEEAEIVGRTDPDIFTGEKVGQFCFRDSKAPVVGKATSNDEWIVSAATGEPVLLQKTTMQIYSSVGEVSGVLGIGRDITVMRRSEEERQRLENQLNQAKKIESVGHLAGGVAHDFNNMLGIIIGRAEMALKKTGRGESVERDLEEIRQAARSSADLTRQLLTFARKQVLTPVVLDTNEAVTSVLQMLRRLIGENIELSWQPAAELWSVTIDPTQFNQILTNLCVNARDAIDGNGSILIEAENLSLVANSGPGPFAVCPPGDYVQISVRDDGCGIDAEISEHIFEPFYSTKGASSGTGLGLATVYSAVKQSGGFVTFESEPGRGTVFYVCLPRGRAQGRGQTVSEKQTLGGDETILLVEDDENLLETKTLMLQESGYRVLAAATPGLAIEQVQSYPGEIHLLISDLVMPKMNGRELAGQIRSFRPNIGVLFMSGYTSDIVTSEDIVKEGLQFLQKPISFDVLTSKVREILDQMA
jgi:PAS domain S-box-containing protein